MSSTDFLATDYFVLEVRPEEFLDPSMIRCTPRRMSDFLGTDGKQALLHRPRGDPLSGYFGFATIECFEPDPRGDRMFVFLNGLQLFDKSVSTLSGDQPREAAPLDHNGETAFSFYSNGLRRISAERFVNIVDAAGSGRMSSTGFEEAVDVTGENDPPTLEETVIARWKIEERRVRARHRLRLVQGYGAFCCMSGASFDVPDSFSLLQVSHFRPLGRGGPDRLTNVGLMTPNVHAIYENGLATVRSDFSLRFAPDIPPGFLDEFRGRTSLQLSGDLSLDPAEENIAYHREEIFLARLKRRGLSLKD